MKNFGRKTLLSFGSLLLAAMWLLTAAAQAATPGAAQVKKVVGTATYTDAKGNGPLKEGDILFQGATITTGAGSYVDLFLSVNGDSLRVEADSTLSLNKLDYTKGLGDTVVNTQIEVKRGSTVANVVNKLSKASKYEIKTPAGVAGIRGTVLRCGTTRITCLIGTVSFVPTQGGGVAIVINGGNAFTPGSLAAVRAGGAETSGLAKSATALTANSAVNMVAHTVQQFTAALAADAATEAAKTGGNPSKAAADSSKAAIAELVQALQQAVAEASPQVKAAIQAVAASLVQKGESIAADAAAKGAGIAVKVTGGTDEQAKGAARTAAGEASSDPTIVAQAVAGANAPINAARPNQNPTVVVDNQPPAFTPPSNPAPPVNIPPVIYQSPTTGAGASATGASSSTTGSSSSTSSTSSGAVNTPPPKKS